MSASEIESRLLRSPTVESLLSERAAAWRLTEVGWSATHSAYYRDLDTGKFREVDVVANRIWIKRSAVPMLATVHLVVEVKTMRDFHIVYTPLSGGVARSPRLSEWIGSEGTNLGMVRDALRPAVTFDGLERDLTYRVEQLAYPNGVAVVADVLVAVPPPVHAAAFRETNTASEKELENSVLWRASLGLRSAVASLRTQAVEDAIANLRVDAEAAARSNSLLLWSASDEVRAALAKCDTFHPVAVLDAALWEVGEGTITASPWFRFEQVDARGNSRWWCDVVCADYFTEYVVQVTRGYEAAYSRAGALALP